MDEDLVVGLGQQGDRRAIPLATKEGRWIANVRRLERPPDSLRASVEMFGTTHPAARLRSITNTYNCVGMVFASRRTWVDPDQLGLILNDDGFRRADRPEAGDLVVYRDGAEQIEHVGVVLDVQPILETAQWRVLVLSKWGGDGEYIHFAEDVPPQLGRPVEYWTERKGRS